MKVYVKLRDKGTIFHDTSQDVSVTALPVLIETTKKVNAALKAGILLKVDEKTAKLAIATAEGNKEEVKSKMNKDTDAKVATVQGQLDEANSKLDTAKEEAATKDTKISELEQTIEDATKAGEEVGEVVSKEDYDAKVAELETATLGRIDPEAHKKVVGELADLTVKFNSNVKTTEQYQEDYTKAMTELGTTKEALKTTKTALAEAIKKAPKK